MNREKSFAHLHVHSEYSIMESTLKIDDIIQAAIDNKFPAIALTDHGVLSGAIKFYNSCIKHAIKPIIGFEANILENKINTRKKKSKTNSIILLAKNNRG